MPTILDNQNLMSFFTPVHFWNGYNLWFNPYNFVSQNSNTLVVTVGASWTWGDGLGCSSSDIKTWEPNGKYLSNNNAERLENCYGRVIANKLHADWLNLSAPGYGNFWIADKVEQLADLIPLLKYEKIYIVCTLTETGRGFNTVEDRNVNYYRWFEENSANENVFDDFLVMLNESCIKQITSAIAKYNHVTLIVGTDFVDHIGLDLLNESQLLQKTWCEVLGLTDGRKVFIQGCLDNFDRSLDLIPKSLHLKYKEWAISKADDAMHRIQMLYTKQFTDQHPDAYGHCRWAEYILEQLNR